MSPSDHSRTSVTETTQGLPIPELIEHIKHSFHECEEKMEIAMENLKGKVSLLKRNRGLAELEKLKIEEKLQMSENKCDELKETVEETTAKKLKIEEKLLMSENKCDELKETVSKLVEETTAKDKLILELNEKNNLLENKHVENERFIGVYQENIKCLLMKMSKEIEDLRPEKFVAHQKMEEFDVDQNVEAAGNIDVFMSQNNLGSGGTNLVQSSTMKETQINDEAAETEEQKLISSSPQGRPKPKASQAVALALREIEIFWGLRS